MGHSRIVGILSAQVHQLTEQNEALRLLLRVHALKVRKVPGARTLDVCGVCDASWPQGWPEVHAASCQLARSA